MYLTLSKLLIGAALAADPTDAYFAERLAAVKAVADEKDPKKQEEIQAARAKVLQPKLEALLGNPTWKEKPERVFLQPYATATS